MEITDAHVHLGDCRDTKFYDLDMLARDLEKAGCSGAAVFAFPEDMYRLRDEAAHRARMNGYCLECAGRRGGLLPFYFIWNDFAVPEEFEKYKGVKWHRHADEPRYDYGSEACERAIQAIRAVRLPVVVEEEFENTVELVRRLDPSPVIIPHMGMLNGGSVKMDAFFGNGRVHFDTALAPPDDIRRILAEVGPARVVFGSDVSGTAEPFFNFPKVELGKLDAMKLDDDARALVLGENIKRLVARGKAYQPMMVCERAEWGHEKVFSVSPSLPEGYALRTYRPGDEAAWCEIAVSGELGCWTVPSAKEKLFERPEFRPDATFFAVHDGRPVGTACLWSEHGEPFLHMVAVAPEHRGRRLGAPLVAAVLKAAFSEGKARIYLHTDDWRLPAVKTYLKFGFRPMRCVRHEDHSDRWAEVLAKLGATAPLV